MGREKGLAFSHQRHSLITHHFANLERKTDSGIWKLYNVKGKVHVDGVAGPEFRPEIVFPVANDECLLHLIYSNKPFGAETARSVFEKGDVGLKNDNPLAKSNDGQALESCFAAATMCASQYRDKNFKLTTADFVENLANELVRERTKATLTEDARKLLKRFTQQVPYFPPANMSLCDFYRQWMPLGYLERTPNKAMIDYAGYDKHDERIFSGESKDWDASVNLRKLLVRAKSRLHFVVCNQSPHSTKATRPNTMLRVVSLKEGKIEFVPLGKDPKRVRTLVLLFELSIMGEK